MRLHQILINLVGNAIKFTENGGVRITAKHIDGDEHTVLLQFTVHDSGIGLSRDHLDTLFSAFWQADTPTTRRYGGTGLGLAISKRLVELMQGEICCESEQSRGSEFTFARRFELPTPDACACGATFGGSTDESLAAGSDLVPSTT